jgi:hypothetical protein
LRDSLLTKLEALDDVRDGVRLGKYGAVACTPYEEMELADLRAQLLYRTGASSRAGRLGVVRALQAQDLIHPRVRIDATVSVPVEAPHDLAEGLGALTVATLKARLQAAGLSMTGRKADLVRALVRLDQHSHPRGS